MPAVHHLLLFFCIHNKMISKKGGWDTESMLDPFFFSNDDYGILDGMGQLASMNMNSGKLDTRAIYFIGQRQVKRLCGGLF
jgi:hypothetical protein